MEAHDESRFRSVPFSWNRRTVAASASAGRHQNNIHLIVEADITEPRRYIRSHRERTGERLSLTAFVIACLGRAVAQHPHFNAFRRGRRLIRLRDITVGAMVEREINGELVPEPLGIRNADRMSHREVHEAIRAAQELETETLGESAGIRWFRFIPGFLLKAFVRIASRSVSMVDRYGAICVTAIGMFGGGCMTPVPLSGATIGVSVGGIVRRAAFVDGALEEREHLCLTVSANHDIIDGAPAARFVQSFTEFLGSARVLEESYEQGVRVRDIG